MAKRLRLRRSQCGPDTPDMEVSVEHGYLWIGGKAGPCRAYITGRATLHKIAAMLTAHAI